MHILLSSYHICNPKSMTDLIKESRDLNLTEVLKKQKT